ncbi:hypothetical protein KPH14_011536 [Odynerus spinipes]|uniref:Uncharacterized protein n=1 Tax=Odynerus spinipes TaxID=1348599 RepID=A0AAD9VP11_9HYME|nr:hypothetical protein KPH14_011536 [Odynerus spinipes]
MHYALHVSLLCGALFSAFSSGMAAKSAINPDILTTFAKNVASVLSPTLLGDLQNARNNKSYVGSSSIGKKLSQEDSRSLAGAKDSETEAATPEIYREQGGTPYRLDGFSNTRRQTDELYNPYGRPDPYLDNENPSYRQSQFYDPYNVPNNYFQTAGPNNRNALRGNLNLDRPVDNGNLVNTENAGSPGRLDSGYRPDERILNDGALGRRFGVFNGFAGYSSFEDRRRGDVRYHHSPLPVDGHYFGPFGFDPHVPYHHPLGYKHPYVYNDRRPSTDSNNSGENNASKEETKEEETKEGNDDDRPKSDRRHYHGGYKPFYGFPGYPVPLYKFGPGYYHRGDYNDSSVGHRHYDDPYYHKHYDFPYYDDFYFPGPFHPYGYGPRPRNGNKNGVNDNGTTPETQENKDTETISASEKREETVGASSSEYERRIPAVPFEDGFPNERIVDREILDSVERVDLNNNNN